MVNVALGFANNFLSVQVDCIALKTVDVINSKIHIVGYYLSITPYLGKKCETINNYIKELTKMRKKSLIKWRYT